MSGVRIRWVGFLIPNWAAAQSWGNTILINKRYVKDVTPELIAHELVHRKQWQQHGVFRFIIKYATGLLRHGYNHHPLEQEADELAPKYYEEALHLYDRHCRDYIEENRRA